MTTSFIDGLMKKEWKLIFNISKTDNKKKKERK